MKNYLKKGYRVFIDNFFTFVQLVYDLLQNVTSNEKHSSPKITEKVEAGKAKFWNCDNLVVTHWKD